RIGERLYPPVLEKVDQLAQSAFVSAEAIRGVESAPARTAKCATPGSIEREGIPEGGPATGAEIPGHKRLRTRKACGADWDAGEAGERNTADAAFVGIDQGKKRAKGGCYCLGYDVGEKTGSSTTT